MTQTLPIALIAGLLAGGAGAVAITALRSASDVPIATVHAGDNEEVLAALSDMRADYKSLADRVEMMESQNELAPLSSIGRPARVAADAPAISQEDLQEAIASLAKSDSAGVNPMTAQLVESVIEQREERAKQERDDRRQADREKRLEDKLGKMQSEMGLDMNQVASLRTVYQDQETKQRAMWDEMREARENGGGNMDRNAMRTMWATVRDERSAAIEGVLTPSQFVTYGENGYDNRGGFGGGRGNRGGGNGNGNGGARGNRNF